MYPKQDQIAITATKFNDSIINVILVQKIFSALILVFLLLKYFSFYSILIQGNRYNLSSDLFRKINFSSHLVLFQG